MDVRSLEHPTLKVPYEILNKRFRTAQKVIDREVNYVNTSVTELDKTLNSDNVERSAVLEKIDVLKTHLEQLKTKGIESVEDELAITQLISKRTDHLKEGCIEDPNSVQLKQWKKIRLDRMLVEYFLRTGFYKTAIELSKTSEIEDLTNIDIFLTAKEVEESLQAGDISKCLAWCHDNKSRLRKLDSTLEFNVRLQEFIELVKKGEKLEAVRHAKKYLATDERAQLTLVQQGMALLVFPVDTQIQPYKDLFTQTRWQELIEQFRQENYRLHQLSSQSVLSVSLQAGLSSLKTPLCYKQKSNYGLSSLMSDRDSNLMSNSKRTNIECPVCNPALNALATNLPFAHCSQSKLVCYISGKPLNENNLPMMLPNGYVYGQQALLSMAEENQGRIICKRTGEIFSLTDLEKVYVM